MPIPFIYLFPILFSLVGAFVFSIDNMGNTKSSPIQIIGELLVHTFTGAIIGSWILYYGMSLVPVCIIASISGFIGREILKLIKQILLVIILRNSGVTKEEIKKTEEK